MFSSDGSCSADISSYESDAEMCSCSVDSKEFFELTHYQILPWQIPILIPAHNQIPPVLPVQIVLRIVARKVFHKSFQRIPSGENAGFA